MPFLLPSGTGQGPIIKVSDVGQNLCRRTALVADFEFGKTFWRATKGFAPAIGHRGHGMAQKLTAGSLSWCGGFHGLLPCWFFYRSRRRWVKLADRCADQGLHIRTSQSERKASSKCSGIAEIIFQSRSDPSSAGTLLDFIFAVYSSIRSLRYWL